MISVILMVTADLIAFLVAALVMNITPGTDVMFIASQSMGRGLGAGTIAVLGVGFGILVHIIALALGLSKLVITWPWLIGILKVIAIGYLLWLAWRAFRAGALQLQDGTAGRGVFWKGTVISLINLDMALLVITFIPEEPALVWAAVLELGGCFLGLGLLVNLGYALLFVKAFSKLGGNRKVQKVISRVTGVVFLGLAARLLVV